MAGEGQIYIYIYRKEGSEKKQIKLCGMARNSHFPAGGSPCLEVGVTT
jgi:hypothetical protein